MRRLPPRPVAVIERDQERQAQVWRVRLTDPEAPRDRRLTEAQLDAEKAERARRRQATADEAAQSAVMAELRTPGSPLRVLGLACVAVGLAHDGTVTPNDVRTLVRPDGTWVPPLQHSRSLSGLYSRLVGAGLLMVIGEPTITGVSGHNNGKESLVYRLTDKGRAALSALPDTPWLTSAPKAALLAELDPWHDDDEALFSDLMNGDKR